MWFKLWILEVAFHLEVAQYHRESDESPDLPATRSCQNNTPSALQSNVQWGPPRHHDKTGLTFQISATFMLVTSLV